MRNRFKLCTLTPSLSSLRKYTLLSGTLVALLAFTQPLTAQTFTLLHTFSGGADGANPEAPMLRDTVGNLYGTASAGGAFGSGVVFKLDSSGTETVLYSFTGAADGQYPVGNLLRDKLGNIYSTTYDGGSSLNLAGTVFMLNPSGKEKVLYSFTAGADGGNPDTGLIVDSSGNFYGTTESAGAFGFGTVFKVDPAGTESVLFSFPGGPGCGPPFRGTLIRDAAGNLYGTTPSGGGYNQGCVYKLDEAGKETILYRFTGGADGGSPYQGLIRDEAGNLYGTTISGGAFGAGTVFRINPHGKETVLYSFAGGADGKYPFSALTRDPAGNLYGTTWIGGASDQGTVFRLDPSSVETVLYTFTGGADGGQPITGLVLDKEGNLYGNTWKGAAGYGTVFKLTP